MSFGQAARILGTLALVLWLTFAVPLGSLLMLAGMYLSAFGPVEASKEAEKKLKFVGCFKYKELAVQDGGAFAPKWRCVEWADGTKAD